jgi:hypothetical protein
MVGGGTLRTFSQILVDVDVRASHLPALDAGVTIISATIASATGAELTVVDVVTPTEIGGMLPSIQEEFLGVPRRLDDIATGRRRAGSPQSVTWARRHMVTHSGGQAARRSIHLAGSPPGTATACSSCSWSYRIPR